MMPADPPGRWRGVFVALVTPLTRGQDLDEDGLCRIVDHTLAGGVHGLLALGSTGEATALDRDQRRTVLRLTVDRAAGRVPVLAGVAHTRPSGARAELQMAAEAGADAALVAPPFYAPIDQAAVLEFYRALARASPLPILAYNIPAFTKVKLEPATVRVLWQEGAIVGIKDSSRDFEYFEQVLAATRGGEFVAFTGTDTMLLASMILGAAGAICLSANVAPLWPVRIYDAVGAGDLPAAVRHQDVLLRLVLALRAGTFPAGIKAALEIAGLCEAWPAVPVPPLAPAQQEALRAALTPLLAETA